MFKETIKKIASGIVDQYETIFSHAWNEWTNREDRLISFLSNIFPKQYWFSWWEVFDTDEGGAGQIDVIMYDKLHSYVFHDWNSSNILAPVESTYGIIEIKSMLTTAKLSEALSKIDKYNSLSRSSFENWAVPINPFSSINLWSWLSTTLTPSNQPLNIIFAYDTNIAKKTLIERISWTWVDLLIIPNKYVIIWRSRDWCELKTGEEDSIMDMIICEWENSVAIWILYMQWILKNITLKWIDIREKFISSINDLWNFEFIPTKKD